MVAILMVSRHTPEDCPMNNKNMLKLTVEAMSNYEALAKKHGVKVIGVWSANAEHLNIFVYDAPNYEAFQKLVMEPPLANWLSYQTNEYKVVTTVEETKKMLQQAVQAQ